MTYALHVYMYFMNLVYYTCILLACCGEGDGGCHGSGRAGQEGRSGEGERERGPETSGEHMDTLSLSC